MKVTLAVLAYGNVFPGTVACAMREVAGGVWDVFLSNKDAAVDRARSKIATRALDEGFDVCVMVDHDLTWEPGDLGHIAAKAHETGGIVGGLVSKRQFGQGFGGRFGDGEPHRLYSDDFVCLGPTGFVGGAFTAYHRSALERIQEHHKLPRTRDGMVPFFLPTLVYSNRLKAWEYLSEDWSACWRAHEAGVPVHVAMRPRVVHHGLYGFTLHDGAGRQDATHVADVA